ncbi:MAG: type I restriction enzyme HsdR N-terminal domain-containing protein [Gracilimonas sp.]|uniref:type I restriction enzyme HsdR N-terminal domain-containing protein n=1 Tax=Gracilimonas sp. TaxID=1974203 RepID=UPI001994B400|nr:type I restriction enzyme HsdR N-terminal domain-containing protein [Gracilimonas sp.]MBD3617515.1 type I restriction enzyme HsdR N-terminal domain-containing protein [Gracilimonas sp.]
MPKLDKDIHELGIKTLKSEEDLRSKLLMPFLKSIGHQDSDLILEKNFTIKLGRDNKQVKYESKGGRLDILCRVGETNLFVVEVKKPNKKISKYDEEQGVSYARLLNNNIAPFVVITNGSTVKIIDSITRKELTGTKIHEESSYWKNGMKISGEDIWIRFKGLESFISFSPDNLKSFCVKQVESRIKNIAGDSIEDQTKYIESLYVRRVEAVHEFESFLSSNDRFFAIIGDSGVGKSNLICDLVNLQLSKNFTLFFNGSVVAESPSQLICNDLNLVFSEQMNTEKVFKYLNELGERIDKKVIIFIDALDEYMHESINTIFSELALKCKDLNYLKFCVSCKSELWKDFLYINNDKSYLFNEIYSESNNNLDDKPGYHLKNFNKHELNEAIKKYKAEYSLKGEISKDILSHLSNGFYLRAFSEVFKEKRVPKSIINSSLLESFILKKLESLPNSSKGTLINYLSEIGKCFFKEDVDYPLGISTKVIRYHLNLPPSQDLPSELFTHNILIRNSFKLDDRINFYFSKMRDYIIAYHSYRLDKLDEVEFRESIDTLLNNRFGQSAVYFYSQNCNKQQHLDWLFELVNFKYLSFVNQYDIYLEEYFKPIKNKFKPHTNNRIGILLPPKESNSLTSYALYPAGDLDLPTIVHTPLMTDTNEDTNFEKLIGKFRINSITYIDSIILNNEPKQAARRFIEDNFKEIINNQFLNFRNSKWLLIEEFIHLYYFMVIEKSKSSSLLPNYESLYPINVEEVKNYSASDPYLSKIFSLSELILDLDIKVLDKHYLPKPDYKKDRLNEEMSKRDFDEKFIKNKIEASYSKESAKLYVEKFLTMVDESIKTVLDSSIPKLASNLTCYEKFPNKYYVRLKNDRITSISLAESSSSKTEIEFIDYKKFSHEEERDKGFYYTFGASFSSLVKDVYSDYSHNKQHKFFMLKNWVFRIIKTSTDDFKNWDVDW